MGLRKRRESATPCSLLLSRPAKAATRRLRPRRPSSSRGEHAGKATPSKKRVNPSFRSVSLPVCPTTHNSWRNIVALWPSEQRRTVVFSLSLFRGSFAPRPLCGLYGTFNTCLLRRPLGLCMTGARFTCQHDWPLPRPPAVLWDRTGKKGMSFGLWLLLLLQLQFEGMGCYFSLYSKTPSCRTLSRAFRV